MNVMSIKITSSTPHKMLNCIKIDEWINKMCYIPAMEYY